MLKFASYFGYIGLGVASSGVNLFVSLPLVIKLGIQSKNNRQKR